MALPDLTGINIENSYQRVVHTDGVNYYNGTGSLLNLGPINTGSFATTGSNTFIGSQIISGSGVQVPLQVVSGSTTLLFVSQSGRIGMGTSTPSASLDLRGDVRLASAADGANALWFLRNSNNNWSLQSVNGVGEIWRVAGNTQTFYQVVTTANGLNVTPGGNSTTQGLIITSGSYPAATLLRVGVNTLVVTGSTVGIGTTTPSATLDVSGSVNISGSGVQVPLQISSGPITLLHLSSSGQLSVGTPPSTYKFQFSSSAGTDSLAVTNGNNFIRLSSNIGSGNPGIASSGVLHLQTPINGTGGNEVLQVRKAAAASFIQYWANNAGVILSAVDGNGNLGIGTGGSAISASLSVAGTTRMSGSFNTAASGSILTVQGSGSAQPIFTVLGSQGELFSIVDSLSGSLFSVNDISGLPILEVFSDGTTLIGDYLDPMLITTKKSLLTNSGSFTIYSLPTASYDTAFFDYSVRSGSNARAGQIMAIQSGSSVNYTETTTTDFGTTTGLALGVFVSGSNMVLTGSAATTAWTIKAIIRSL